MPSTIKDDKGAIAPVEFAELQKHTITLRNPSEFTTGIRQPNVTACTIKEFLLRKFIIGGLAALVSIGLAGRVDARYVNLDCAYPTYVKCRDASRFLDLNAFVDGMYIGGTRQFITGRYGGWYGHLNAGDYIDKWWYSYLDEGQYYYLDRGQYKLLGGLSYLLGHPSYPKLYERRSEQAVGFTNRRGAGWFGACWKFQVVSKPVWLSNEIGASFSNVCIEYAGPLPVSRYVVRRSCFNPGDYIDKWRYYYLDKGRYRILDEIQYKWLGGMAYLFESPSIGNWYTYGSPYSYDFHCLPKNFKKENITANISSIPEPATIGLLGLGGLWVLTLRNKRRAKFVTRRFRLR